MDQNYIFVFLQHEMYGIGVMIKPGGKRKFIRFFEAYPPIYGLACINSTSEFQCFFDAKTNKEAKKGKK